MMHVQSISELVDSLCRDGTDRTRISRIIKYIFKASKPSNIIRQRVTHDCASILDSIANNTSFSHCFSHGASLHQHSFSRMIFTPVLCCLHTTKDERGVMCKRFCASLLIALSILRAVHSVDALLYMRKTKHGFPGPFDPIYILTCFAHM